MNLKEFEKYMSNYLQIFAPKDLLGTRSQTISYLHFDLFKT